MISMARARRRSMRTMLRREALVGYLLVLPNILGMLLFVILPVFVALSMSFANWNFAKGFSGFTFAGIDNYLKMLDDVRFGKSILNNFYYTFLSVPLTIALSVLLACVLNKSVYFKRTIRVMYFMPNISSIVSVAIVWLVLFYPKNGPINMILTNTFGIQNPPGWFVDANWAMPGIILMSIWNGTGYFMIIMLSGLQNISPEMYEAAEIDGAGTVRSFFHITLPLLAPTIFFSLVVATINSFKVFDSINILTGGGPGISTMVLVYLVYFYGFQKFDMGYASAIAMALFVIIFLVTLVQWWGQKKWVQYD